MAEILIRVVIGFYGFFDAAHNLASGKNEPERLVLKSAIRTGRYASPDSGCYS